MPTLCAVVTSFEHGAATRPHSVPRRHAGVGGAMQHLSHAMLQCYPCNCRASNLYGYWLCGLKFVPLYAHTCAVTSPYEKRIRKIIKDIHTPWCIVVKGGGIVRESYFRCPLIHGPYFTCCVSSLSLPCLLMLVSIDSSWTSWCHCPLSYCSLGLLILHTRGTQFRYVARSLGPAVLRSIAQG